MIKIFFCSFEKYVPKTKQYRQIPGKVMFFFNIVLNETIEEEKGNFHYHVGLFVCFFLVFTLY